MSYHNHDYEERNPPRSGGDKNKRDLQLVESIEKDVAKAQATRDAEIANDIMMLDRLKEFDLTEKEIRSVRHLVGLPDGRGIPFLINWIQGRTGSCILHYDNKHVQKMPLRNFNERDL
jgi:hypothetical protein